MYQKCAACDTRHRDISAEELRVMLNAYVTGEAQVVTPKGIFHRCILTLIGVSSERNERKIAQGGEPIGLGV